MISESGLQFRSATADLDYKKMLGCEQISIGEENEDQLIAALEPVPPVFEEGERVHSIDNNRLRPNYDSDMPVVIESYSTKVS